MALHMTLRVNGDRIGHLAVQRRSAGGAPAADSTCLYDWQVELNGETIRNQAADPVEHRFGDGAWVLVGRVLAAAGYDPAELGTG